MATARQPVLANGEVLAWARERWGLDRAQAAKALGLADERLAEYETGIHAIEPELLEKMTKAYQLSATNLILRNPPHERGVDTDFRTVGGQSPRRTTELIQAITTTVVDQELATALAVDLGLEVTPRIPQVTAEQDAESVGTTIRRLLEVSDSLQKEWGNSAEAFRQWRWRVEALGILVFLRKLTPPEEERLNCRGFSNFASGLLPAIAVNANESKEAQCFTLMHEFVHLLRRESGICDEHENSDARQVERFCNRVAAAALMPRSLVMERIQSKGLPTGTDWSEENVNILGPVHIDGSRS
ncbi:MAG: XRE family transcriptional regulator [Chloroflexi bacterium]|nr:XRE family transcriptional regulator [Chloroflexota bacterium]